MHQQVLRAGGIHHPGPAAGAGRRGRPADRHVPHPQHDESQSGRHRQGLRQPGPLHRPLLHPAGGEKDEKGASLCRDGEGDQDQYQLQTLTDMFPHPSWKRKNFAVENNSQKWVVEKP